MKMNKIVIGVSVGLLLSVNLFADAYDNGYAEHKKGNFAEAVSIFTKACDDGDMKCCFAEGKMYALGKGVAKDLEKAKELYNKSCEGGDTVGCQNFELLNQQEVK